MSEREASPGKLTLAAPPQWLWRRANSLPTQTVYRDGQGSDDDSSDSNNDSSNPSECGYDADIGSDTDGKDDFGELEYFKAKRNLDEMKQSRCLAPQKNHKSENTIFKKHEETVYGCYFNANNFKEQYRCLWDAFDWYSSILRIILSSIILRVKKIWVF